MKRAGARLQRLERDRPQNNEKEHIRAIVRALTLDEARFCLWVIRAKREDATKPTDHPEPTEADEKRAAQLLKLSTLKGWK